MTMVRVDGGSGGAESPRATVDNPPAGVNFLIFLALRGVGATNLCCQIEGLRPV